MGASKIPAWLCELDNVVRERRLRMFGGFVGHQLVQKILVKLSKGLIGRGQRLCAVQHSDPEDSPAQEYGIAMRFRSLSAVLSFARSALHPDFRIL